MNENTNIKIQKPFHHSDKRTKKQLFSNRPKLPIKNLLEQKRIPKQGKIKSCPKNLYPVSEIENIPAQEGLMKYTNSTSFKSLTKNPFLKSYLMVLSIG